MTKDSTRKDAGLANKLKDQVMVERSALVKALNQIDPRLTY